MFQISTAAVSAQITVGRARSLAAWEAAGLPSVRAFERTVPAPQPDEDFVPVAAPEAPAAKKKSRKAKAPRLPHVHAEDDRRITDPGLAYELVTGGCAKMTFKSLVSGRHYTFMVARKPPRGVVRKPGVRRDDDRLSVSVRTAEGYDYIGICKSIRCPLHVTDGSLRSVADPEFKAFQHVWSRLLEGRIAANTAIYFEDRCISCGRELTNPSSIARWMGKDCAKRSLRCMAA